MNPSIVQLSHSRSGGTFRYWNCVVSKMTFWRIWRMFWRMLKAGTRVHGNTTAWRLDLPDRESLQPQPWLHHESWQSESWFYIYLLFIYTLMHTNYKLETNYIKKTTSGHQAQYLDLKWSLRASNCRMD